MAKSLYLFTLILTILISQNSVYADSVGAGSGQNLAARLEAFTQKRLPPDDFRRLARAFSQGLELQKAGPPQKFKINYSPEFEIRYLVCLGGSVSGGISFAGTALCSDMNGRVYGLEFGLIGAGLSLAGVIWGGYWILDLTSHESVGEKEGHYVFSAAGAGGAYMVGGRALCAWGKGESELCMVGLELGAGLSAAPHGYLTLTEHKKLAY